MARCGCSSTRCSCLIVGTDGVTVSGVGSADDPYNISATSQDVNAQTGTAYTAVLSDAGSLVTMTNAAASAFTVPPNSSVAYPIGTYMDVAQLGAGQVTITPGSGVTLRSSPGLKISGQYLLARMRKIATDTWLVTGSLSA